MTIPNLITLGRLVLVPFVIAMIGQGAWALAFAGFALAGLSDAVDGYVARRFNMKSELGAYLDALADKALLVSIFVALAVVGAVPAWLAIVIVSRDVMVLGAILLAWLLDRRMAIRPLLIGKLNTALQIVFAGGLLGLRAFGAPPHPAETLAAILVAALAAASVLVYGLLWMRHMSREEAP
ncbi:CDP-alcohol phosphatidyltransferase [Methylobacterium sp. 4-46]|uniref:CDP-alcohol phosphatidyltransferase family protein n=1 Tax=unclassified Methylobacterium TaxID=2615210 RepID=UPI000165CDCD|nr:MULTISPECIES: CDP-alcohol phosphatidyltransferase family protein [Methylobacterium]ACA19488.1 CDP-alcohol phosphatidyltransferase [Methylobacterium sp. 4-46]WFT78686.1 CDP-alcohol phosphatidyltransferase family protein [Methylobacterium nodulans]